MANENEKEVPTQSFNDDELADIMKEIEGLEQEFSTPETVALQSSNAALAAEAKSAVTEAVTPSAAAPYPEENKVLPMTRTNTVERSNASSSMEFKVSGEMAIDLKFTIGQESVEIMVDGLTGLTIQLAGGAQFILPLNTLAGKRQAS